MDWLHSGNSSSLRVEIADDPEILIDLAPWWNAQSGPSESPFLRSEWFHTWAATRLLPDERLHVLIALDGDEPVAALPLVKRGMRARALSDGVSDAFDIVQSGESGTPVLLEKLGRETHLLLDRVDSSSPLVDAVEREPGWRVQRRLESPYIDLTGGWDTLTERMGRNLKKNLRRGVRRLESLGELSIETMAYTNITQVLDEAFDLEARGWKGRQGTAVADDERKLEFFRTFGDLAAGRGWLRLAVARLDGQMVAFNYDIEFGSRMYGILTSYDETLDPRCSLGSVLMSEVLEEAVSRGVESYEMGGDSSNEWKMMWTSKTRPRVDIVGFGSDLTGTIARTIVRTRRSLKTVRRSTPVRS